MTIEKLPHFGKMGLDRNSCRKVVASIQRAIKRRMKHDPSWSVYEYHPVADADWLAYHQLPSGIANEIDIEVRQYGQFLNEQVERVRQILGAWRYNYRLFFPSGWAELTLSLSNGESIPKSNVFFSLHRALDQTNDCDWVECWQSAYDILGLTAPVKTQLIDGLTLPATWHGRATDSRGFDVYAGPPANEPTVPACILSVDAPTSEGFCVRAFAEIQKAISLRWLTPPISQLYFTVPTYAIPPVVIAEASDVVGVWNRLRFRYDERDHKRLIQCAFGEVEPWFDIGPNEITVIPVVNVRQPDNFVSIAPLRVNAVRHRDEIALEIQSFDPQLFQWIADTVKRPIELWNGDHKTRWGWYFPPSSTDFITIVEPSGSNARK